ncbi:MAG: Uma2 family endonuclease [Clostridiales bacterium]|jgi:Uma2 family endonuclease|nr:Uma2 family endonuclease [Clostridiales bacterium]
MDNQQKKFDYHEEPPKTEKINGIIYNMAAGTYKHAETIGNLYGILHDYFKGKSCRPYTSELDIFFDEENNFRPDISLICDFSKMRDDGYHGAPTLVIEVLSVSTAKRDRREKFNCYEKYGVKELWLINPEHETIEQYDLIDGTLQLQAIYFRPGTIFKSYVFEDLAISLDEAFDFYKF